MKYKHGGYTSYDKSPSDHRWLWFDIKINKVVGASLHERARPLERKATSKVPSIRERFNELLNEQIVWHKLDSKTQKLDEMVRVQMSSCGYIDVIAQAQMDKLNEILVRLVKTADSQCQKGRRGTIPSLPALNNIRGAIRILRLIERRWKEKSKKGRPHMSCIRRLANKYNYHDKLVYSSLEEIQDTKHKKMQQYKSMKPFAQDYRETYLGRIAEEMSNKDGKEVAKHFRYLMKQEEIKQQFCRIRAAEGRPPRSGVGVIEKETCHGDKVQVTDKVEIEDSIMVANKTKLLQAGNTPLRMTPLQELLGEQLDFEKWEEILQGKIQLPEEGIEEGTRLWYQYVSSQTLLDFNISWSTQEYFESWQKMKEEKSSAPGIHIGHLKCIDPDSKAANVISTLALLPLQTGYAPALW